MTPFLTIARCEPVRMDTLMALGADVDPVALLESWRSKVPRISPFENALATPVSLPGGGHYSSYSECILAHADKAIAAGNAPVADWLRKEASQGEVKSAAALRLLALGTMEAAYRGLRI